MIDATFEHIPDEDFGTVRCIHRKCTDLSEDHSWHFHSQYEIVWVIDSIGTRFVGDSVDRYGANDLVLTGPNLPHCWRNDRESSGENEVEWIVIQFDKRCFGSDFLELPEATSIRALLAAAQRGAAFGADVADKVGPLLRQILDLSGMRRLIKIVEILDVLAEANFTPLAAPAYLAEKSIDHKLIQRLERIQVYISEHFRGLATQAEIAAQLDMAPTAFSKFMRAHTGRTFMSMLKLTRINEACRILATSSARITDIALECGYQHTSHFDRHFHEIKGLSPTEYRDRMRALEASAGIYVAS